MAELEVLTEIFRMIRQITRGVATVETKTWAYEQMDYLIPRMEAVKKHQWSELNYPAKINLSPDRLKEFYLFKDKLWDEGHEWEHDAYDILTGFIWDATEGT